MKRILFVLLLFVIGTTASLQAQMLKRQCGTKNLDVLMRRMLEIREEMKDAVFTRDEVTYVPIRVFRVGKNDGSGRISERQVYDAICLINETYEAQNTGIQFYLKGMQNWNKTQVYENSSFTFGLIKNKVAAAGYNAINVFIVNGATEGAAAYYQGPDWPTSERNDWIVVEKEYLNEPSTWSHELGHFFSLPHPFYGWESEEYFSANPPHQNPLETEYAPDGSHVEYADESNCTTTGDRICDTPADYMFPQGNCVFSGIVLDPHGDTLHPMENNMMNYFFECPEYIFTDDQRTNISNSLFGQSRAYIRTGYVPDMITESVALVSPVDSFLVEDYNAVPLHWNPVPNATKYLVQVSRQSYFSSFEVETVVTGTDYVADLKKNKRYFWRVRPMNKYQTCEDLVSEAGEFLTGDNIIEVNEIDFVDRFSVQPNPVASGTELLINFAAKKDFTGSVVLYDLVGRTIVQRTGVKFSKSNNEISVPLDGVAAGLYMVSLQTNEGRVTARVVVSE